jgi:hypothetical protein
MDVSKKTVQGAVFRTLGDMKLVNYLPIALAVLLGLGLFALASPISGQSDGGIGSKVQFQKRSAPRTQHGQRFCSSRRLSCDSVTVSRPEPVQNSGRRSCNEQAASISGT